MTMSQSDIPVFLDFGPTDFDLTSLSTELKTSMVSSRGINGDIVTTGLIVTISVATIKATRDVLIAFLQKKRTCRIKWKGYEFSAESSEDLDRVFEALARTLTVDTKK